MGNYFAELNGINVSDKTEKKNGLTYLSWAWAWGELKKRYPLSFYTVYENSDGWNYFTDGKTCWVKTGVTVVDGDMSVEHIEYLPVMDFKNKSISADAVTSFDVNKTIQRSLTKAVARHGLGLYVYAGEDLPEDEKKETTIAKTEATAEMKNMFQDVCKSLGQDPAAVIKQAGWSKGPVLEEHIAKANQILKKISDEKDGNKQAS